MVDTLSISQHMESHYRRIATTKGRIDTSLPTAMKLGMKTRDRHRKKKQLAQSNHRSRAQETTTTLDPVLDFPPGANNRTSTPRSELYYTQTGRVSARSPHKKVSSSPPAWVPVMNNYISHSSKNDKNYTCTYDNRSTVKRHQLMSRNKPLSNHKSKRQSSQLDNITYNNSLQVKGLTKYSKDSTDMTTDSKNPLLQNSIITQEGLLDTMDGSEFVTQRMLREALAERNAQIRQKIEKSHQEEVYLQFMSAITNDILTRGVYDDSMMESLFESHVSRNKHRLNEHLMRRQIEWLKKKLTIT